MFGMIKSDPGPFELIAGSGAFCAPKLFQPFGPF